MLQIKKIIRSILLFSILIFSFSASSQNISYHELVFPAEINKYPILFSDPLQCKRLGKTESRGNPASTGLAIKKFIEDQKASRNIQHQLISPHQLKNYAVDSFRFFVQNIPLPNYD